MSESNIDEKYIPRLLKLYRETVVGELKKEKSYSNSLSVPKLIKITVNMGLGEATSDKKIAEKAAEDLTNISGQKAKICCARKAISNFKLRAGQPIGCCVTLRKAMMYEFLDRLVNVAIPRIRDFRGLSSHSFDGNGNYTFGLTDQTIFPEINLDKVTKSQGMNISIHTSAKTDDECKALLKKFNFPFRR